MLASSPRKVYLCDVNIYKLKKYSNETFYLYKFVRVEGLFTP